MYVNIIIAIISLFFSAFFSGVEIAFITSSKLQVELDRKKGIFSAKIYSFFNKRSSEFIATLLVGNNIALVIYGISMVSVLSTPLSRILPAILSGEIVFMLLLTAISTLIVLVSAEFMPKSISRINPNIILHYSAIPALLFYFILFPLVFIFSYSSRFLIKWIFRVPVEHKIPVFAFSDLDMYINEIQLNANENSPENTELQMFRNAIDFRHVKIRECMVPRTEIEAIDIQESIDILLKQFIETGYSKILVFDEIIDKIIGYVHAYDVFKKPENIENILRPMLIVPETILANSVLSKLINEQRGVAVVVDEFGGTSGMVTIEDIIEEIFGEIYDEFDVDDLVEKQLGHAKFIFSGRLEIDYLNDKYGIYLPVSMNYETLAGMILNHYETIPVTGERIKIGNFIFKIIHASSKHIDKVLLEVLPN